jgi:hypothetical protein
MAVVQLLLPCRLWSVLRVDRWIHVGFAFVLLWVHNTPTATVFLVRRPAFQPARFKKFIPRPTLACLGIRPPIIIIVVLMAGVDFLFLCRSTYHQRKKPWLLFFLTKNGPSTRTTTTPNNFIIMVAVVVYRHQQSRTIETTT